MNEPVQVQQLPTRAAPAPLQFTGPGALASRPSLVGAQVLAATIQAPPLLGYYYGMLALLEDEAVLKRCLDAIADRTADMVVTMMDAAYKSLGLQRGDPRERFAYYQMKTPAAWAEQQAKYPGDFAEDLADYEKLKLRAAEGDL